MSVPLCEVDFVCKLCNDILKNPHQAGCCGKHFCKSCVDDRCSTSESATCPECNATEVTFFQDKHFERLMTLCGCSKRPTNHSNLPHDRQERAESPLSEDPHRVNDVSLNNVISAVEHKKYGEQEGMRLLESKKFGEADVVECGQPEVSHVNVLSPPHMGRSTIKEKPSSDQNLEPFSRLSLQLSELSKKISKRQDKVEQMLNAQEKILKTLYTKVEILEKRVSSHALLPYTVTIPNIDSYIEGRVGDEWISPEFYTETYSNKGYKLQLSVVPNSLHMRKKERALSARLLIARGENDHKLNWPFLARYTLIFTDPSGTEKPYEVVGRHTWESPGDESSMQFLACITHKDLLKYVQQDNSLQVCINNQYNS